MPTRPSQRDDAARARPARLIRLRRLPKHKIHRVALIGRDFDARAGNHLIESASRQRSVARGAGIPIHRGWRKEHVVLGDIREASRDKTLDDCPHFRDMLGRARFLVWGQATERSCVLAKLPLRRLGDSANRLVQGQAGEIARGSRIDLIVDIRDVARIDDLIRTVAEPQQPVEDIEHDDRTRIADMRKVIDRRTADIEPHVLGVDGFENLPRPGQRVV